MAPKKDARKGKSKAIVPPKTKRPRTSKSKDEGPSIAPVPVPSGLWDQHHERFQKFNQTKVILPNAVIDWSVLACYGLVPAMRRLLRDPAWLRLFSLEETAYKEVTLAFLASFKIEMRNIANKMDYKVSFFAFGRNHQMTMRTFVKAMGLYSREELDDPEFGNLPTCVPSGAAEIELWRSISREARFRPSKSKVSTFYWTSHRFFHYLVTRSLNSKKDSASAVTKEDILPLFSVVNNFRVNVGILVAFALKHQAGTKMNGIYLGQMITRILKNLKYWPIQVSRMPKDGVAKSVAISHGPFKSWGTKRLDPDPLIDAEIPGSLPPPPPTGGFSVGSLAQLEADVADIKKNQNIIIKILTKLAEKAEIQISSCFSGSPPREQPELDIPSTSAVPQLLGPPEQFAPLDIAALQKGEPYYSSEDEEEGSPEEQMEESAASGSDSGGLSASASGSDDEEADEPSASD